MINRNNNQGFTRTLSLVLSCFSNKHLFFLNKPKEKFKLRFGFPHKTKARLNLVCGFTIIELIVSVTLFIVVTLVSVGALLNIIAVNKKSQSLKSVINNINFAVEGMSKSIRVGTTYHCEDVVGQVVPPNLDTPKDCSSGGNFLAFEASDGNPDSSADQIVYRLNGVQIERSINGGSSFVGVTAPEVSITSGTGLRFYVVGALSGDNLQPKVIIVVSGEAGVSDKTKTKFNIQTSVSQRKLDS